MTRFAPTRERVLGLGLALALALAISPMIASVCHAQSAPPANTVSPVNTPQKAARAAIAQTLADDTDMYQRYVYNDAQTVGKQVPVHMPVMPDSDVQAWLTDHVAQIMSVTPSGYTRHKAKVSAFFVPSGWAQLEQQWLQAQIPQLIRQQDYVMNAMVVDTPRVVAKGRQNTGLNAAYRWIIDVPILLTYTDKSNAAQAYTMSLRIGLTRIPMRDDGQLIAIDQWSVTPKAPVSSTTP